MIDKIREYFIEQELIDEDYCLNVDFLGEEPTEFTISKVNVDPIIDQFVNGDSYRQFEFNLLSRNIYSAEVFNNVQNSNFFDDFRDKVEALNKQGVLPDIQGIETIECLDSGGIATTTPNTAQYSILMRITYYKKS